VIALRSISAKRQEVVEKRVVADPFHDRSASASAARSATALVVLRSTLGSHQDARDRNEIAAHLETRSPVEFRQHSIDLPAGRLPDHSTGDH